MDIHFVSLDEDWVHEMQQRCASYPNIQVSCANIKTLPRECVTYVSPANSLGFMDGGIDWVLSREMFYGLQDIVQRRIERIGLQTVLGRYYLPVGSACIVPTGRRNSWLICAPTMFLPHDVSGTRNAYWSFLAALVLHEQWCQKTGVQTTLIATSHCCGYGCMSAAESARQMMEAYSDFCAGVRHQQEKVFETQDVLLYPNRDAEQPTNRDNREIKEIVLH
jgi:O-acetyl-ADP-ribose deacetylase (regulator of RNase III)